MSRNDTSIYEQLKALNWSIDDLFKHIIIEYYRKIENNIKKEYPHASNKRNEILFNMITDIPVTRQTLYNIVNNKHKHKTTYEIAELILNVINTARKIKDKKAVELDFSELDIIIYHKAKKI